MARREGLFQFDLRGVEEMLAAFEQLPKAVAKGVLVGALKEAAQPVVDHAKSLVPVKRGRLRDSIAVSTKLTRGQMRAMKRGKQLAIVYVGPSYRIGKGGGGRHGHLVEFGTAPHFQPKYRRGFHHPGTAPHPFMRPAWDANQDKVLAILRDAIWKKLKGAARSLAKRAAKGTLSRSSRRALGGY